jgi:hypothetical protein
MANIVAGETYYELDGQLSEIKRQLRQQNGYPFNTEQLRAHLQAAIEGRFIGGEQYLIDMGVGETADNIVLNLKAESIGVNSYINSKLFPLTATNPHTDTLEILDPGREFDWSECPALLKAAGLDEPTAEHGLRFARKYGSTTTGKKPIIVFPHEPVVDPRGRRRILCFRRGPQDRYLVLGCPDDGFDAGCVLAGVRRAVQPSVS